MRRGGGMRDGARVLVRWSVRAAGAGRTCFVLASHSGGTVSNGLGSTGSDTERADHGRQAGRGPG